MSKVKKAGLEKRHNILSADTAAIGLVFLYIAFFSWISALKYNSFSYDDFDLAVHAQTLYNILHGSIQSSILGIPFLGNHLNFVLFLIVPMYAVFKSALTLLLLQAVALGLSAYPIYLVAKEELPRPLSLAVLFSYLLYPSIGYVNTYEFHPTVFATFFLSLALYMIYKNRFIPFLISIILALTCQENIPILVVPLGIYMLCVKKAPRWWLAAVLTSGVWFLVGTYKLIPYFGKGTIKFIAIYGYLGNSMPEVAKNIITHPAQILGIILLPANLIYLCQILGPVLLLPVLSPLSFMPAIPTLLQHILSVRETEHTIYYHYTAEIIPFVFFAAVFALKRLLDIVKDQGVKKMMLIGVIAAAAGGNIILGPHIKLLSTVNKYYKTDLDYVKETFLAQIPKGAEVAGTFEFLPKLSARKKLYSLHHASMGKYTLSNIDYELPKSTEYIITDFEDILTFKSNFYIPESGSNLRKIFMGGDYGIVNILDTIALFKKGYNGNYRLYEILPAQSAPPNNLGAAVNADIELAGFEVDKGSIKKGVIAFRFYWRCLKKTDNVYGAFVDVFDRSGRLAKRAARFICYRVYPTNEWAEGQVIMEDYRLLVPGALSDSGLEARMGVFNANTGMVQEIRSSVEGALDGQMRVNLIDLK